MANMNPPTFNNIGNRNDGRQKADTYDETTQQRPDDVDVVAGHFFLVRVFGAPLACRTNGRCAQMRRRMTNSELPACEVRIRTSIRGER